MGARRERVSGSQKAEGEKKSGCFYIGLMQFSDAARGFFVPVSCFSYSCFGHDLAEYI